MCKSLKKNTYTCRQMIGGVLITQPVLSNDKYMYIHIKPPSPLSYIIIYYYTHNKPPPSTLLSTPIPTIL